jgi:hypothetical protein
MTRRRSLRHLKFYLTFVVVGIAVIYSFSFVLILIFGNSYKIDKIIRYSVIVYGFFVLILFPLLASSFFSLGVKSLDIKRSNPRLFKELLNSPLRFIIWDEIITDDQANAGGNGNG